MEIAELVESLEGQGASLTVDGDRVLLRAPAGREPCPEVLERLRRERHALVVYLRDRATFAPQRSPQTAEQDYHARVEAALEAICRPDYLPGMILWLEKVDPGLYDRLTCTLPDQISRLWNAHAPLYEFQGVVDEWLASHSRACSLFKSREQ
jgi:hypothetical protein